MIIKNIEVIQKSKIENCTHINFRVENHTYDDNGGWFTCINCGFFAYVSE